MFNLNIHLALKTIFVISIKDLLYMSLLVYFPVFQLHLVRFKQFNYDFLKIAKLAEQLELMQKCVTYSLIASYAVFTLI